MSVFINGQGSTRMLSDDAPAIDRFFYWINERHAIYQRKMRGDVKPWTLDPILQTYKFTNAFRQLDTGTVWLMENFTKPHNTYEEQPLLLFNICLYRHVNWWPTFAEDLGWTEEWNPHRFSDVIADRLSEGKQAWTGAHIIRSRNGWTKADSVAVTMDEFWKYKEDWTAAILSRGTLEAAFNLFKSVNYIGDFLAYEFASDLRWTLMLENATDILSWANAGPGAKRGLRRIWPDITTPEELGGMRKLLELSKLRRAAWTPPLEMREIEHSLCEFDKYERVRLGEGRPRSTYPGRAQP